MLVSDQCNILRICGYGFLTWLIPFIISIPFYSSDGSILIDQALFKSIMVVTGAVVGAVLIVGLYTQLKDRYIYHGIIIGVIWLLINWLLDIIILLPLTGLDFSTYFNQIGFRYLIIPVMTIMAGHVGSSASKTDSKP